jgi:nicotinamidase/pyrazinamidase
MMRNVQNGPGNKDMIYQFTGFLPLPCASAAFMSERVIQPTAYSPVPWIVIVDFKKFTPPRYSSLSMIPPIHPNSKHALPGLHSSFFADAQPDQACNESCGLSLPRQGGTLGERSRVAMVSEKIILWEVDTQADFMLPAGKLYVPGAEKLLPNIRRLTDAARQDRVFLVSHGCFHTPDDPEFKIFPPHCVQGTAGAEFVPEALTDKIVRVPNDDHAKLPSDFSAYQQILLEKQTLNIFESRHADALVHRLGNRAEFVVFGVVTEYCVGFAAKGLLQRGRRVAVVSDAIETLKPEEGNKAIAELQQLGARLITAGQAIAALSVS